MEESTFGLVLLGLALGLRHGVDWDHLAAITDITGSTVGTAEAAVATGGAHSHLGGVRHAHTTPDRAQEAREGFFLATLYALGHAAMVIALGLLAIWAGAILPAWLDPVMERLVGLTLLLLGVWIFYSLWRYGSSFQLRSRWMLLFSFVGRGWSTLRSRLTGRSVKHSHDVTQYGPKTAFGIGLIHGIGAETGSQALLLASAAGATTQLNGSLLLLAFVFGLVASNSLVGAFSAFGFVSSAAKRTIYTAVGIVTGVLSLLIGGFFVLGQGASLPDLQQVVTFFFGSAQGAE